MHDADQTSESSNKTLAPRRPSTHRILVLERLKPLGLGYVHSAEAGLPLLDACVADPVLTAQVRDRDPGLELLRDTDDLLFREAAAPHILVLAMGQNELQTGSSKTDNVRMTSRGHSKSSPRFQVAPVSRI